MFGCVQVTPMVLRAEQVCTYDLDDVDQSWLNSLNGERALMGLGAVTGDTNINIYSSSLFLTSFSTARKKKLKWGKKLLTGSQTTVFLI